jgi:hypothetical protein
MTALRLAEHVAHTVDVDGMLDSMTPKQFDEWCLKDRVEPIGEEASRHILALIGVTIARSFGGAKDVTVENFMPWLKQRKTQQSDDQMMAVMSMIPGAVTHGITG